MGLPINIEDILAGRSVEWERLEFKRGWNPEDTLHTLCAFANDFHNLDGGYIFIGFAEEDGKPVRPAAGLTLESLDGIQKKIMEIGNKIHPRYHPIVEPYEIDGTHILALRAPGGQNRPYKAARSLSKGNQEFKHYIRRGPCTVETSEEEVVELQSLAAKVPFDDRLCQSASLADLDIALIQKHLSRIQSKLALDVDNIDFATICRKMTIVDGPLENTRPRNVGLMFFNEHPEHFFPQTQIDVVQMPKGLGGDILIEKTFKGPIDQQLRDVLAYIRSHIVQEYVVKRPDLAEADRFVNYPYAAIEELLANAVYHRSYEDREPIEVRILPDHMTITSLPGPDRSISLSDLSAGRLVARRYRNRRIGEFLKELRLTEGRGTGIPKAIQSMRENGSPAPSFLTDEERNYFIAQLPAHPYSVEEVMGGHMGGTPHVTPQDRARERIIVLLGYCVIPRTRPAIQFEIGLKDLKHLRERYLNPLVENGMLRMTEPDRRTSREQKYQTTTKGIAYLSESNISSEQQALPL